MGKSPSGGAFLSSLILEELRVDKCKEVAQVYSLAHSLTDMEEFTAPLLSSTVLQSGEDAPKVPVEYGAWHVLSAEPCPWIAWAMFIHLVQNLDRSFHNVTVKPTDF